MADTIHDPLAINLRRQTRLLLQKNPQNLHVLESSNATSFRELLAILSRLLAKSELTELIAVTFRPILTDLCARWVEGDDCTEEQLSAIAFLVEPQEELYPILDRMLRKEKFKDGPLGFIKKEIVDVEMSRLHSLLLAYFRILQANREIPDMFLWPLMPLSSIIWSDVTDNAAKLLAIQCYAMQSCMGEAERENLEREVFGEPFGPNCLLEYGLNLNGENRLVDGWLLPVIERERILKWRSDIPEAVSKEGYYTWEHQEPVERLDERNLSPLVVNVNGVLLLRSNLPTSISDPSILIPTPAATAALRILATYISLRLPTLLTSAPSTGKSLLLTHLVSLLHPRTPNQIITIHLADTSLDSRALLGSYISSPDSPGTFEWKEGVLVRAMRGGRWVVFEDVDKASSEVLGTIRPLIESMRLGRWIGQRGEIYVPGKGKVVAEDSFRVFATRSLTITREDKFSAPTFLGSHKFWEIIIPSPTKSELQAILNAKFAKLRGVTVGSLIHLWEQVRQLGVAPGAGKEVGVRELEKFCARVESLLPATFHFATVDGDQMDADDEPQLEITRETPVLPLSTIFTNPSLREDIFVEAQDVFFGAGAPTSSARAHTESVARTIGNLLGLDVERQDWLQNSRVPVFLEEKDINGHIIAVSAGYTRLTARLSDKQDMAELVQSFAGQRRPFAMHRPAAVLLSRIARAVVLSEAVLLTGETGTGKTSAVTHLACVLHRKLVSLNLSHQTESGDLIGGFKPVDPRVPAATLMERWEELFGGTFSRKKNEKFEVEVRRAMRDARWGRLVGLWRESGRLGLDRITRRMNKDGETGEVDEIPRKRRKIEQAAAGLKVSQDMWDDFLQEVGKFEVQHVHAKGKFAFGFVEGPLVKALRSGDWILLDEINLASPETLECITGLLHCPTASITLTEQGSLEPVPRHPEFRLFACMNPATDVGKKDLPPNIRARFTEMHVPAPDADRDTLLAIVAQYIGNSAVGDKASIMDVAEFYQNVKMLAEQRQIADGSNHRPLYSMRTLTRALMFANDISLTYGFPLRRALWEASLMAFTMSLDKQSAEAVTALAQRHIFSGVKNPKSLLAMEPKVPRGRPQGEFIKFGPFYLERGSLPEDPMEEYIVTPSVERKLIDLARIVLTRRFPVLIEGPTSSGKTSAVEYLAKRTGHRFVRINNHEHTDIQEYIGSYVSDPLTGKLVFKDGLLVRALRNGDWIVLDELNLAPTDVLEALNRLLDDNRELVIPETQEVVKPHPHFMLFATQNPPGLYAGRKVLSRAFRNRFLEVHFEDVPQDELETILCQRCRIAPSYGKKIVAVFHELQKRRQTTRVFESKHGFATLRDLFRWAGRDAVGYQSLAENGYMLIGERARREDDKAVVKEVIESIMGVKIEERKLYNLKNSNVADIEVYLGCSVPSTDTSGIVWTSAMQRLFVLVSRALRFNEPVLLVGETGAGKTSVSQIYADAVKQRLLCLNCHQNTETADLIGGLRPVRNRRAAEAEAIQEVEGVLRNFGISGTEPVVNTLAAALNEVLKLCDLDDESKTMVLKARQKLSQLQSIFEWHDGPLIEAMHNGDVFLLDEISLADDSVLERLNSVLEHSRTIVLAEKGGEDSDQAAVKAQERFKFIATMNPGGDYGKKELSPALRNRFTEIWVPPIEDRGDLELIVNSLWKHVILRRYTKPLLDFVEWLCLKVGDRSLSNLRDVLAWLGFLNSAFRPASIENGIATEIFHYAAHMTFLDGLGSLPQLSSYSKDAIQKLKSEAEAKLEELVPFVRANPSAPTSEQDALDHIKIGSFAMPKGPRATVDQSFNLQAPTTQDNAMRIVRACQLSKPILLEGSPGVGKTSLVTALANLAGYQLYRLNLSDQTDIVDLFGSDLPVEGGGPGEFAWRDAEFLRAMQMGHWVLLDEMNLAPQAVLEGLNAVLDHRGAAYIPELGRSFTRHPSFRIFATQNPLGQGGGRKGLPKSFVNRFTKVYVEELSPTDLSIVCRQLFPQIDSAIIEKMIKFNMRLNEEVCIKRSFGQQGSPWEFNLRDVIRWAYLLSAPGPQRHPVDHLRTVYLHRFRTKQDRLLTRTLFDEIFGTNSERLEDRPLWTISPKYLQFGHYISLRKNLAPASRAPRVLKMDLSILESIGLCISQSWLTILTGPHDSGKTEAVRLLAYFTGNTLQEISINSAVDTMDILGSFEQVDIWGQILAIIQDILVQLDAEVRISGKVNSRYLQECRQSLRQVSEQRLRNQGSTLSSLLQSCLSAVQQMYDTPSKRSILARMDSIISESKTSGLFQWVDGPLVDAMKNGHWMLLDNANLCNPSVLDRLNSLCEPDGFLTLSERGFVGEAVQIIKPHPDFRLFMTVDPQYGELSRAMRNRGIEIHFLDSFIGDDPVVLLDYLRSPETVNSENWKLQCLLFDQARRGLHKEAIQLRTSTYSSGRSLDRESALNYIIDDAPKVIKNSLIDKIAVESLLYFYARTAVPCYTPVHRRSFTEEDAQLRDFQDFLFGDIPCSVREACAVSRPMDFFLVNPLSIDESTAKQDIGIHYTILQMLNFVVASFLFENDFKSWSMQQSESYTRPSVERAVSEAIDGLLKSIHDSSQTILGSLRSAECKKQAEVLDMVTRILNYGRYLCKVMHNLIDHSALISLAQCILDTVSSHCSNIHTLQEQAQHFNQTVTLSSGLGLFDIWASFYIEEVAYLPKGIITRIDELASSLKEDLEGVNLRQRTFDYLALVTLVNAHDKDREGARELGKELVHLLSERSEQGATRPAWRIDSTSLVVELSLLSFPTDDKTLEILGKEFVDMTVTASGTSLLRVVPYKHLLWFLERGKVPPSLTARMHLQWLYDVWGLKQEERELGPSILCHPVLLSNALSLSNWSQRSLASLPDYEKRLHFQTQLTMLQCQASVNRSHQLLLLLSQSLCLLAQVFAPHVAPDTSSTVSSRGGACKDLLLSISGLISSMEKSSHTALAQAAGRYLMPTVNNLTSAGEGRPGLIPGQCFVGLSFAMFNLLVPSAPIDPAAVQNSTFARLEKDSLDLSTQIMLHRKLEELITGNVDNGVILFLLDQLESISSRLLQKPQYPIRQNLSRLHMYWAEVSQFCAHVLNEAKINNLFDLFAQGVEEAALQEQVVQQSIAGFYQRLDTAYAEFADTNLPLKLSMLYLRLGLRLVADAFQPVGAPNRGCHYQLATSLANYPGLIDSSVFVTTNTHLPTIPAIRYITLHLSALSFEIALGIDMATKIDQIDLSYQKALRLWLIDRAKEGERDEEAGSLYRPAVTMRRGISEAELEEQELLALFPSFEDVYNQESHLSSGSKPQPVQRVPLEDATLIADVHLSIMETSTSSAVHIFNTVRRTSLEHFIQAEVKSLPPTLDDESLSFQLSILYDRLLHLRGSDTENNSPDFYFSANICEVKKALIVVEALKQRLNLLLIEWPEQMVLHHLREKCAAFLALNIGSPLAKLLAGLEQLLIQSDDWEMYANKENTLKAHRQSLTNIIIEWRRLELSSWRALLDSQAKVYASETSTWWFRLYEACIYGALDARRKEQTGEPEALSGYLANLIPLLDDFMASSSVGQFQARLQLLRSFERYLPVLRSAKPEHEVLFGRVQSILYATTQYFDLYSSHLARILLDQKVALEKEIQEFIRLASWKDTNVQALKASAQKTHRQLFKVVRKFREVLKQPIRSHLQRQSAGDAEVKRLDEPEIQRADIDVSEPCIDESDANAKIHLFRLKRTFSRYMSLIATRIHPFIHRASARVADDFAIETISMARELSNIVIRNDLPAEKREKQQKALVVRKRKAWSDLLRELKRAGLSPNPKASVLQNLRDERWVREQPVLHSDVPTAKIEIYFSRLRAMMPQLRASLANHHSDISTRELERGLMSVESGFWMAIDLRRRLADAIVESNKLNDTRRRIGRLSDQPKIVASGTDIINFVCSVKDALCRLSSAFHDVRQVVRVFKGLKPQDTLPEVLISDVQSVMEETTTIRDKVVDILTSARSTKHFFLLADEYEIIVTGCQHIKHVRERLQRWALRLTQINHIILPIIQWIESQDLSSPQLSLGAAHTTEHAADSLIDSLLVIIQSMLPKCADNQTVDLEETDRYILQQYQLVSNFTDLFDLHAVTSRMDEVVMQMASRGNGIEELLQRVLPFLDVYLALVREQLSQHCQWTKALFKLDYAVCSIMLTVSEQGFCKPPDASDADVDMDTANASNGVGLGGGTGMENVSKEVEDENQVEGLKGEKEEGAEHSKANRDEDAIEMNEDISGDMEDVPEEGAEDDGSKSDEESDEDPEECLGKLDASDPSAVDEKLWGDERGPESLNEKDGKTDKDHGKKESGDSDIVAKENEREGKGERDEEQGAEESPSAQKPEKMEEDLEGEGQQDPRASGAPLEDHIPEADILDLPDDLNLEDQGMGSPEELSAEEMEGDHEIQDELQDADIEDHTEPDRPGLSEEQGGEEDQTGVEITEQEGRDADEESPGKEEGTAQADVTAGDGESTQEIQGIRGVQGEPAGSQCFADRGDSELESRDAAEYPEQSPASDPLAGQQQMGQQSVESTGPGSRAVSTQQRQPDSKSEMQTESNPLRSLGDALKEIRQRFDDILGGKKQEEASQEQLTDTSIPSQVQYLHPEEDDHEMQALGPAGEEQVAKLDDLKIIDDASSSGDIVPMDLDTAEQVPHKELPQPACAPSTLESDSAGHTEDVEGAMFHSSIQVQERMASEPDPSIIKAEVEQSSKAVEVELRKWQSSGFSEEGSERIWRLYESLTHNLAYTLCEQLRLILEPTLATRLRGDYRTGKRLNMKKIISYIASDYTKDKIWLRRTRPSQREYQVLIAIDDSRSMAESHSVHLAYQTLALVAKALSRLESGDIAIAKFGESVQMLHDFDEGQFTNQAGTKVINSFHFNQRATNVLSLVETSLKVLESARERRSMSSATAGDLWQLEIIISDGLCQDHDRLRTMLRKAEEQRVMIVFIVVDSLHSSIAVSPSSQSIAPNSILNMDKAEYTFIDGRMELQLHKYLDSFPFEYYVVLRDVEALPDVLAGTLKQFLERVSES